MSQSDYIQFIKTVSVLGNKNMKDLPPVLTEQDYTAFEKYALETTVFNTKNSFSRLLPQNTQLFKTIFPNTDPVRTNILGMEKKVLPTSCVEFICTKNTNTRPNRELNSVSVPRPTIRIKSTKRTPMPKTCTFKYGSIIRTVRCSKKVCKCRGRYVTPNADPSIKKAFYKPT
jgi:hypothetical protein